MRKDQCGQCLNEYKNATLWNNCLDCEGVAFGGKELNDCDFCLNRNDTLFDTYGKDCTGNCADASAETYEYDRCGQCLSTADATRDSCVGCDDVPFSNKTWNPCNKCIDKNDPNFNDIGRDCTNNCPASEDVTYYMDDCGQCLLKSNPDYDNCCEGDPNKRTNECGLCIIMNSTYFNDYGKDCAGTCDGDQELDECDQCLSKSSPLWNSCLDCEDVPNGGKKLNDCGHCLNPDDDTFDSYGKNCDGECLESTATLYGYDRCGICLATSDSSWDSCVGCDNIPNSGKKLNGCGVCVDENDENFDDYGTDCSGNCTTSIANTYYMDDCGQCLLTTDEKWNNCLNVINPTNDASSNSGNNDGNGGGSSSDNGVLYIIIAIAAFVLIIIAFGVICWQCKRHNEMKRQFNDIIQNYRPMDDLAPVDNTKKSKKKSTRGGTSDYTTSVPAEESD